MHATGAPPTVAQKWPDGHGVALVVLDAGQYWAPGVVHATCVLGDAQNEPTAHATGAVEPAAQYVPGGQAACVAAVEPAGQCEPAAHVPVTADLPVVAGDAMYEPAGETTGIEAPAGQ